MNKIEHYYNQEIGIDSDIHKHLPKLREFSAKCEHITELGVRKLVSTWAFLAGLSDKGGGKLVSIDIKHPSYYGALDRLNDAYESSKEAFIDFNFVMRSSLDGDIEPTDMLFIDTVHNYDFLSKELGMHHKNVKKYIAMHDTDSCKLKGDLGGEGLLKAVDEFLGANKEWVICYHSVENNGLTILERVIP